MLSKLRLGQAEQPHRRAPPPFPSSARNLARIVDIKPYLGPRDPTMNSLAHLLAVWKRGVYRLLPCARLRNAWPESCSGVTIGNMLRPMSELMVTMKIWLCAR